MKKSCAYYASMIFLASMAHASPSMYVFGDSLSDSGNVFAATGGLEPPAPYFQGRFSNGFNWADDFAAAEGYSATASLAGGTNFAYGGAEVDPLHATSHDLTPNIGAQIQQFAFQGRSISNADLFAVWGGGNDLLDTSTAPAVVADNVIIHLNTLYALGARNFLVLNLPSLGDTPAVIATGSLNRSLAEIATNAFNTKLALDVSTFASKPGAHVHYVDVYSLEKQVNANPAAYGFTDVQSDYLTSGSGDPNNYVFWDNLHPTAHTHQLIARAAVAAVPEPCTLVAGAGLLVAALKRRYRA